MPTVSSDAVCGCGYVDCDGKCSQAKVARLLSNVLHRIEAGKMAEGKISEKSEKDLSVKPKTRKKKNGGAE